MTGDRNKVLAEIAALAAQHQLSAEEVAAALAKSNQAGVLKSPARDTGQTIVRILSYVGGLLVFAGVATYTGMQWFFMNPLQHVVITLGPGIAALMLLVVCLKDQRCEKAATPLLLISAALQPLGLLVFLHDYMPPSNHPELAIGLVFLTMAAQQALLFLKFDRTTMLFLAALFAFSGFEALAYWLRADMDFATVVFAFSGFCITHYAARSGHSPIAPWLYALFGLAMINGMAGTLGDFGLTGSLYVLGAGVLAALVVLQSMRVFAAPHPVATFFIVAVYFSFLTAALQIYIRSSDLAALMAGVAGFAVSYGLRDGLQKGAVPALYFVSAAVVSSALFNLVAETPYDVLLIGFGVLLMYISVILSSRTTLAVSVISLLCCLGYYTDRYFAHALGWPLALIGLGLALILISGYAFKLGKKMRPKGHPAD